MGVESFLVSQFKVRLATDSDLGVISDHRAHMFRDMGELPSELFETFRRQSLAALRQMFAAEKYVGWLASPLDMPDKIVAGAGVQLREVPPHPVARQTGNPARRSLGEGGFAIVGGRQAIIQNVFAEPEWRRRGLGTLLMKEIIAWSHP